MRKFNLYMHEHTGELNQIISKTIASIEFNVEAPEFLDEYFNICQLIVLSMVRHPTWNHLAYRPLTVAECTVNKHFWWN